MSVARSNDILYGKEENENIEHIIMVKKLTPIQKANSGKSNQVGRKYSKDEYISKLYDALQPLAKNAISTETLLRNVHDVCGDKEQTIPHMTDEVKAGLLAFAEGAKPAGGHKAYKQTAEMNRILIKFTDAMNSIKYMSRDLLNKAMMRLDSPAKVPADSDNSVGIRAVEAALVECDPMFLCM